MRGSQDVMRDSGNTISVQQSDQQQNQASKGSSWRDIAKGLLSLLIVAAIVVAAVIALVYFTGPTVAGFFASLSSLDSAIVVALITGTITILSVIGGGIANGVMKRNEYLRMHREEPYARLIAMFYDFQMQTKLERDIPQEDLLEKLNEFTKELTLWGSSKAIKAWGNWRVESAREIGDPKALLFGMERVLIQLRRDMGLRGGIAKGDLLRLTVNDIDQYLG